MKTKKRKQMLRTLWRKTNNPNTDSKLCSQERPRRVPGTMRLTGPSAQPLPNLPCLCHCSPLEQSAFLFRKIFMKLKWVHLMGILSEMCRHKWHFRVSELVSHLLVDPICPADKWENGDTNNYRNKLNLESGNQAVLSISFITPCTI